MPSWKYAENKEVTNEEIDEILAGPLVLSVVKSSTAMIALPPS